MPQYRINSPEVATAIENRKPFKTHGSFYGSDWIPGDRGILPRGWRELYADAYRTGLIDYVVVSYRTPIAWVMHDGTVVIPAEKYSVSTSRHQNVVRESIGQPSTTLHFISWKEDGKGRGDAYLTHDQAAHHMVELVNRPEITDIQIWEG